MGSVEEGWGGGARLPEGGLCSRQARDLGDPPTSGQALPPAATWVKTTRGAAPGAAWWRQRAAPSETGYVWVGHALPRDSVSLKREEGGVSEPFPSHTLS